ncbi:HupE/UreJ family protein (plasmid) [Actinomadura sp. ATCC 31491]|uniref:HupE/UreJ family protein n=1 Tax=Actinomadura luzonensis TaxID=2805427 RepID=A0ABT0GC08_9ACTN|nr:HupE/UreJ family protein [Actinomadura luzonensis]MCK2222029.1 HupE/UreJ family protein [Actinomadura luzonensis]
MYQPSMFVTVTLPSYGKVRFAVLTYVYTCPPGAGAAREISSALFPDAETFVHSTRTLLRYDLDGERGSAVLNAAQPTVRVGERPALRQAGEFFLLGAEHLLSGLDHVLFLLALLIGARRARDVIATASAFTAAHSITFLLAAMGVVDVPGGLVEPVIAASIVVVALANLLGRGESGLGRWRLPVVFVFGLVHGLGFAGALDLDRQASWELLLSLLSFNVGIEVTQLVLVAALFPLLALLRRTPAHRWAPAALTVPIVAAGLYWLFDRVPLPL